MKKSISFLLAMMLILALPLTIYALSVDRCRITVDSVTGTSGETITVAVRVADNPGFTNFSIGLDYDASVLTLKSIETHDGDGPYLCGQFVSVNDGLVVAACAESVQTDGILFTATFSVTEGFSGTARITPKVNYIRNYEISGAVFQEIPAAVEFGTVSVVTDGDINRDGCVEYDDVVLAYKAYLGEVALSDDELAAVDRNQNGIVEESEYQAIYGIYIGG